MDRRSFLTVVTLSAAFRGTVYGFESPQNKGVDASRFNPIAEGIQRATSLTVYEGLPHQRFEAEKLKEELATKKTIRLHGFPFYARPLNVFAGDVAPLRRLCADAASFWSYRGEKRCGGFHPDYAMVWKDGGVSYDLLICFGCQELKFFAPKTELLVDMRAGPAKHFEAILKQYREQRPISG